MKEQKDQFFNINQIKQTPFSINNHYDNLDNINKPDEKKQQQQRGNKYLQKQKKTVRSYHHQYQQKQKRVFLLQRQFSSLQPQLHCIYNSFPCTFICTNPSCIFPALICSNLYCKCSSYHPKCLLSQPNRLINKMKQKINKNKVNQKFVQTVHKIIDDAVDWLSLLKDNVMGDQLEVYGLSDKEKIVWKKIHNREESNNINHINKNINNKNNIQINQDEVTGRQVSQILPWINQQSLCVNSVQLRKQLLILWEQQILPQFHILFNKIPLIINNSNLLSSTCLLFKQSSIIRSYQLQHKIIKLFNKHNNNIYDNNHDNNNNNSINSNNNFNDNNQKINIFQNKVSQVQLLYGSRQNNNSIQMFYEKCSQIPDTMILIKTTDDRIFGGYTTLTWKKSVTEQQKKDYTNMTYLFKVQLQNQNQQINNNNNIENNNNDNNNIENNNNNNINNINNNINNINNINNNNINNNNRISITKYILKSQNLKSNIISTSYRPSWGPAFGQANRPDLLLINKSSISQNNIHKQNNNNKHNNNNNKFINCPQLYWKIGTNYIPQQYQSMDIEFNYQLFEEERLDVKQWEVFRVRF